MTRSIRSFSSCLFVASAIVVGMVSAAQASPMTYTPVNPSFGGSPLNGSFLMNQAEAQRPQESVPDFGVDDPQLTPAQEFAQTLQRQLLYAVSGTIVDKLLGEDAAENGVFQFAGTTITFNREGNNVRLLINDGQSQIDIVVPTAF